MKIQKNESGRSMVEMLGVLAIIGVLSVMGIAGYKAAMTRHRANELLNEASKRAVVVAGQISLMGHAPSLSEFNEKDFSGGSFELTVYGASGTAPWQNAETDKQFTLSITGVEGNICEQMRAAAEDNAVIQTFAPTTCDTGNDNTVKLTYNNDLSTDTIPSGDDTPAAESCPEERKCGSTCCGTGNICVDGNKCCYYDYSGDEGMCCDASSSTGFADGIGECCPTGETAYVSYKEESGYIETSCCAGTVYQGMGVQGEDLCCPNGVEPQQVEGALVCCRADQTPYCGWRNSEGQCEGPSCCNGTVTPNPGPETGDACCPANKRAGCRRWNPDSDFPSCIQFSCYETACEASDTVFYFQPSISNGFLRGRECCPEGGTVACINENGFEQCICCAPNEGTEAFCSAPREPYQVWVAVQEYSTKGYTLAVNACPSYAVACCRGTVSFGTGVDGRDQCLGTAFYY